ncbi:hypothetical protein M2409_003055 [Sphingobacterium sp. JUb21]|nr:hypothetical protein [Sphingobacterium sp. JUb21]
MDTRENASEWWLYNFATWRNGQVRPEIPFAIPRN